MAAFHARRLPHYHAVGQPLFLTWRLHGSLPPNRPFPQATTSGRAFLTMDRLLDNAGNGPMYLRRPDIAAMIVQAIRYRDPGHYQLHHFVVMPNHVHMLVTPCVPVPRLMQSLKRFTAREANRILGLTGKPFWEEESYDRLVRDGEEFARISRYIAMNPVQAGLAAEPEQYAWSSFGPITNRPQVTNLPHIGGAAGLQERIRDSPGMSKGNKSPDFPWAVRGAGIARLLR